MADEVSLTIRISIRVDRAVAVAAKISARSPGTSVDATSFGGGGAIAPARRIAALSTVEPYRTSAARLAPEALDRLLPLRSRTSSAKGRAH